MTAVTSGIFEPPGQSGGPSGLPSTERRLTWLTVVLVPHDLDKLQGVRQSLHQETPEHFNQVVFRTAYPLLGF